MFGGDSNWKKRKIGNLNQIQKNGSVCSER